MHDKRCTACKTSLEGECSVNLSGLKIQSDYKITLFRCKQHDLTYMHFSGDNRRIYKSNRRQYIQRFFHRNIFKFVLYHCLISSFYSLIFSLDLLIFPLNLMIIIIIESKKAYEHSHMSVYDKLITIFLDWKQTLSRVIFNKIYSKTKDKTWLMTREKHCKWAQHLLVCNNFYSLSEYNIPTVVITLILFWLLLSSEEPASLWNMYNFVCQYLKLSKITSTILKKIINFSW